MRFLQTTETLHNYVSATSQSKGHIKGRFFESGESTEVDSMVGSNLATKDVSTPCSNRTWRTDFAPLFTKAVTRNLNHIIIIVRHFET